MNRAERRRQRSKAGKLAKSTSSTPTILSSAEHQLVTIGHQTHSIPEALSLAGEHHNAGRLPQAESIYQKILQIDPAQPIALHLLGVLAYQVGKNDVAVNLISKALAIKPGYLRAQWGALLSLPILYTSENEIDIHRKRWEKGIKSLLDGIDLGTDITIKQAEDSATLQTNFYLHYQGRNDLRLQKLYGALLHRIAVAVYPNISKHFWILMIGIMHA